MKRHSIWILAGLTVLISLFPVAGSAQDTGITDGTYVNEEYDFQISLPDDLEGWDITDQEPDVGLVVMNGPLFAYLSVSAMPLELEELAEEPVGQPDLAELQAVFLDVWVDVSLALFPFTFDDWKEESKRKMKVGDAEAYEIVATGAMEGIGMRFAIYMFVRGDFGFLIVGGALGDPFPFPLDEFRSIVSTFKFLSEPGEETSPENSDIAVFPRGRLITTWGGLKQTSK